MATFVKKQCEEKYRGTWQCIVGTEYGVSVTQEYGACHFFRVLNLETKLHKKVLVFQSPKDHNEKDMEGKAA